MSLKPGQVSVGVVAGHGGVGQTPYARHVDRGAARVSSTELINDGRHASLSVGRPGGLVQTARPFDRTADGIVSSSGGAKVCVARGGIWAGIASFGRSCPSLPAARHPQP